MHELTVGAISAALRRRNARTRMNTHLTGAHLEIERLKLPTDGPPTWVHVDTIHASTFEECWNEFYHLYSDWFDEDAVIE